MPQNLWIAALNQAERSDPSVKGIAFLRIARVMAVDDRARAEQLMEAGIAMILPLAEKQRSVLLKEAAPLAGTLRHMRHDYRYDDQGNWIEQIIWNRSDSGFEPAIKQMRRIEY